jgi:acetyl esterase
MPEFNIDAEVQAFIDKTDRYYAEDTPDIRIEEQRLNYNNLCRAFAHPIPDSVTTADFKIDSSGFDLKLRSYKTGNGSESTAIVYFHGGGYIVGSLDSHDSICADIADESSLDLFAVDYRLAPEYQYPDDLNDAIEAFRYVAARYPNVIVAGDSAGGNLAAAVCIACRADELKPIGQVLIYPALGGNELQLASYESNAHAPLLTTDSTRYYKAIRAGVNPVPKDPLFYPLLLNDFSGVAPCYAFSADIDPLRDDAGEYVTKLQQAGVSATWINEPGLVHSYLRARHCSKIAGNSFMKICQSFKQLRTNNG